MLHKEVREAGSGRFIDVLRLDCVCVCSFLLV